MAAPFCLEDLAKLKSFVEFVADNPTILNLPELDFFKKLIEKLGGVVPEGTFEMPAGAKCPFFGDVKSESKFTPSADAGEEVLPDMEAESEESEVELDMEANIRQALVKPNAKPPKHVKNRKPTKRKKSSRTRNSGLNIKTSHPKHNINHDQQCKFNEAAEKIDPNDPLFTSHEQKFEVNTETADYLRNQEFDYDDDDDGQEYEIKIEKETLTYSYYKAYHREELEKDKFEDDDNDDNGDDDNESLMLLKQISTGNNRQKRKKPPLLHNCLSHCKQNCSTKYDKRQRLDIFEYYWCLSKDEKVDFIRYHIRKPVLARITNKKRGNNCRYFLKYYKIGTTPAIESSCTDSDGLTLVCRKFFEGTLGISNKHIKEAIDGYELQRENIRPLTAIIKEEQKKLTEKLPDKSRKPKKKSKRREPGEPTRRHLPKPINCAIRCIFKCHQNFSEEERKQICNVFWSLDYKRRKDFILARIERKDVELPITPEFRKTNRPTRAYHTRFYLHSDLNSKNRRVCKEFMMRTLSIHRNFIDNAIKCADKTTGHYTGVDGRGKNLIQKISPEREQVILDHINSYPVWVPSKKSKIRCLHHSLTIRHMYKEYREKCAQIQIKPVSVHYYYKIFHNIKNPRRIVVSWIPIAIYLTIREKSLEVVG